MENFSPEREFAEKIIQINRVSKKTKGGNRVGFSVLAVVGDRKGQVGVGLGKALEVPSAVAKAILRAKKNLIPVVAGGTIPHRLLIKKGAAKILFKPAPRGSGLIAGGPVRTVMSLAGVKNISAKILGTKNKASNVYAVMAALRKFGGR